MPKKTKTVTPAQKRWINDIKNGKVVRSEFRGWTCGNRVVDARIESALRRSGLFCTIRKPGSKTGISLVVHIDTPLPANCSWITFHWTTHTDEVTVPCQRCGKYPIDPVALGETEGKPIKDIDWVCKSCLDS